jgi:hypothetical protein
MSSSLDYRFSARRSGHGLPIMKSVCHCRVNVYSARLPWNAPSGDGYKRV